MAETAEARIKRMKMRSMRRGIKEMDLILGGFADRELEGLNEADLLIYDALLSENDHDLYQWISGQKPTPPEYLELMTRIAASQSTAVSHGSRPV
ncbi:MULTISPECIES: succinate dehydrogenase assembly factor 2 [unclassified Meridianimarinicoccus]|uniref:succinate dehydrogenase assembly factor 2 n=1 Tax=unclassified Meridianimarinicoccus TaxID=2923344 RepID=UPI00186951A6|nr:succinate dehydrogenase assembly factor 2 [Fluviibacterium sp. MJW13]